MYLVYGEGDLYVVRLAIVHVRNGDLEAEEVELVAGRDGKVVKGRFGTAAEGLWKAIESLHAAMDEVERRLDSLEYRLEVEDDVKPQEIYGASYLAHAVYYHASSIRQLAASLARLGLVKHRHVQLARQAVRRATYLRRIAMDLRVLHMSVVQLSINTSMRRLTLLGTAALPALVVSGIYGMNLSWLPLADHPLAVFLAILATTAAFTIAIYRI